MSEVLLYSGRDFRLESDLFSTDHFRYGLFHNYKIRKIQELDSRDNPLIQLADLFAGMGAYSYSCYNKFVQWEKDSTGQLSFEICADEENQVVLSNRDCERCIVIRHLNKGCKKHRLSVSLKTKHGFYSFKPEYPINFWMYESQHSNDKAPTYE